MTQGAHSAYNAANAGDRRNFRRAQRAGAARTRVVAHSQSRSAASRLHNARPNRGGFREEN